MPGTADAELVLATLALWAGKEKLGFTVRGVTREIPFPGEGKPTRPYGLVLQLRFPAASDPIKGTLQLRLIAPSGDTLTSQDAALNYCAADDLAPGYAWVVVPMELRLREPGTHWFEVFLDGRRLGAIPLEVLESRPGADPYRHLPRSPG